MVLNGMKSSGERKREARKLIEWGFREYDNYKIFEKGETITDIDVWLGMDSRLSAFIKDEIKLTVRRTDTERVKTTLHYEEPLAAPIEKGQIVGTLKIKVPNQAPREYPLFAKQSIEKLGAWGRIVAAINYLVWGAGD
jgi:D-alanyl-D-alanine carboxypeptidase (penicillin-binding protein 5/6)